MQRRGAPASYWNTLLLFLLLARVLPSDGLPTVHLRTGKIDVALAPARLPRQRRALLETAAAMVDGRWGPLKGTQQVLVTLTTPVEEGQMEAVMARVEGLGGYVDHYLPDHTLLCVVSSHVAARLQDELGVAWVGNFAPEYKKSPEWAPLLQALQPGSDEAALQLVLHGNSSKGGGRGIHVDKQGRVPVVVSFPPLSTARTTLRHSETPTSGVKPFNESVASGVWEPWVSGSGSEYDPCAAAVAEWPKMLRSELGVHLLAEPVTHHRLMLWPQLRQLPDVLDWVIQHPGVHWVAPRFKHHLQNFYATAIISAGLAPGTVAQPWTAETHPLWAAGLRGENQVVGNGDSGIDLNSCFFSDPGVPLKLKQNIYTQVNWFENAEHRKIRFYRLYADSSSSATRLPAVLDRGGHGTHVAGSLVGESLGDKSEFNGMAPRAKIAFHDLGNSEASRGIQTPWDLQTGYFRWSYLYGARVHSDSWGSEDSSYDSLAWDVDAFTWNNPDFLPVFASGNDGEEGVSTVFSPATAKNTLTVGATLSAEGPPLPRPKVKQLGSVFKASILGGLSAGWMNGDTFNVLQSPVGGPLTGVLGRDVSLVAADPINGCSDLVNAADVAGKVVVMQRGTCYDVLKLEAAQRAGALSVLVANNHDSGYFELDAPNGVVSTDLTIPAAAIPESVGRVLLLSLTLGRPLEIRFDNSAETPNKFDNVADYSSYGPTMDGRNKPDVVAPGTVASAKSGDTCGVSVFRGTSMATPIVAGAALLARQYFQEGFYPTGAKRAAHKFDPSGALIKAVIIGGATPLAGFTETGLPLAPTPSRRQGYGRVTMVQSLPLEGAKLGWRMQVVDGAKLSTGQSHQYCVRANGGPMRITLVWHDLPSDIAAEKNLVNDLDLSVRAAGLQGVTLRGNGEEDHLNNVEQVAIDHVGSGQVSIEVKGHSVFSRYGPQPYALVVHGVFNGALQSPHNPAAAASSGSGSCAVLVAVVTIGPDMLTDNPNPEFTFNTRSGTVPAEGFECSLADSSSASSGTAASGESPKVGDDGAEATDNAADGGAHLHSWRTCDSPMRYTNLPDGSYTFRVRAKGEEVEDSHAFVLDSTPPVMSIQARPPVLSSAQTATVEFSALDATTVTMECLLEQLSNDAAEEANVENQLGSIVTGVWQPCSSPQQLSHITAGEWRFAIRATDAIGNQAEEQVVDWLVELDPNKVYTRILSGPAGAVNGETVRFEFQALQALSEGQAMTGGGLQFQCRLDRRDGAEWASALPISRGWEPCSSPWVRVGIPDGEYRFMAIASYTGANGQQIMDPLTEAVSNFRVDSNAPEVVLSSFPSPLQAGRTAKFAFESTEPGITFKCALMSGESIARLADWSECTSPKVYTSLADGAYTFYVAGEDEVRNKAPTKTVRFQVDGSKPAVRNVVVPEPSNSTVADIVFVVDDGTDGSGVDNVQCRLAPYCVGPSDCDEHRVAFERPDGEVVGHDWRSCGSQVCRRCDDGTAAVTGQYVPCLRCTVRYELPEGKYHFSALAFDRSLNSNSPANYTIVVDVTEPQGAVRSGPTQDDPVASRVRFTFDLVDGGPGSSNVTSTQCLLRPAEERAVKDDEGWISAAASPGVDIAPNLDVNAAAAVANSLSTEAVVGMQDVGVVKLGEWVECREPVVYSELPSATYEFFLLPIDGAGNRGPRSLPYAFQVDATLPIPDYWDDEEAEPDGVRSAVPIPTAAEASTIHAGTAIGISVAISVVAAAMIVAAIWIGRKRDRERQSALEAEQQREYSEQSLFDLPGIASYDSPLANASYRTTGSSLRTPTVSSRPRNATPPATSLLIQHSDPAAAHRSVVAQQAALEDQELRRAIQVSIEDQQMVAAIQESLKVSLPDDSSTPSSSSRRPLVASSSSSAAQVAAAAEDVTLAAAIQASLNADMSSRATHSPSLPPTYPSPVTGSGASTSMANAEDMSLAATVQANGKGKGTLPPPQYFSATSRFASSTPRASHLQAHPIASSSSAAVDDVNVDIFESYSGMDMMFPPAIFANMKQSPATAVGPAPKSSTPRHSRNNSGHHHYPTLVRGNSGGGSGGGSDKGKEPLGSNRY